MKVIANSRHKKTGPQYDGIEQVSMEEIFVTVGCNLDPLST